MSWSYSTGCSSQQTDRGRKYKGWRVGLAQSTETSFQQFLFKQSIVKKLIPGHGKRGLSVEIGLIRRVIHSTILSLASSGLLDLVLSFSPDSRIKKQLPKRRGDKDKECSLVRGTQMRIDSFFLCFDHFSNGTSSYRYRIDGSQGIFELLPRKERFIDSTTDVRESRQQTEIAIPSLA